MTSSLSKSRSKITSLYVAFPDMGKAEEVALILLQEKLIACANILPGATSFYTWKGQIQKETEVIAFFKTTLERVQEAIQRIEELHPYEIPGVIQLEASTNSSYAQWVISNVQDQENDQ